MDEKTRLARLVVKKADERDELKEAAAAILECLVEWQADHEHEWGQGVVLGKEGFRRRWIEKYPCLENLT